MQQKYFSIPFAFAGDLYGTGIPDSVQSDGSVSYTQGWTFDYQRNLGSDAAAKQFQRTMWNSLGLDITAAIRDLQLHGSPEWITAAQNTGGGETSIPYDPGAHVRYNNGTTPYVNWISKTANNMDTPGTTQNWHNPMARFTHAPVSITATGSFTFTFPADCSRIKVTVIGGGAGASGCDGTSAAGACGGGGGWAVGYINGAPGSTVAGSVGTGGTGSAARAPSLAGQQSIIGTISAAGGLRCCDINSHNGGYGGAGSGGYINGAGGDGSDGDNRASSSVTTWPGKSGDSYLGGSVKCGIDAGRVGTAPGAGGSAPFTLTGTTTAGSNGAPGIVIIEFD